jgi:hypothetical protein
MIQKFGSDAISTFVDHWTKLIKHPGYWVKKKLSNFYICNYFVKMYNKFAFNSNLDYIILF